MNDSPTNIVILSEKEEKKYLRVKQKELFNINDLLYIIDDKYAKIGEGNILLKKTISEHDKVLRKK